MVSKHNSVLQFMAAPSDLPHDTGYPYPTGNLAVFKAIRPYSILIQILAKLMKKLCLTTLCPCILHKAIQNNGIIVYL